MKALVALSALALVAGCSDNRNGESAEDFAERTGAGAAAQVGGAAPLGEVNAQPVVAPTGSSVLTPLAPTAPKALGAIAGACSFVYQGRSLLVAGADDAAGAGVRGVLVIDGKEVSLPGAPAGTSQVLAGGVTLAGNGYSVAVKPGSGSAVLTINGPQGETTFAPGSWNCAR